MAESKEILMDVIKHSRCQNQEGGGRGEVNVVKRDGEHTMPYC